MAAILEIQGDRHLDLEEMASLKVELNVCLDVKIESLSGFEADILVCIHFYMVAIMEIQDDRHIIFGGSGSY